MSEHITEQPQAMQMPTKRPLVKRIVHKVTTKAGWLGDFDFKFLCMPQLPYGNHGVARKPSPFYGLEDDLPLAVALVAGFQHSLAMIAGLITPPIIFANALNLPADMQSYMISASLIASGILSAIQMSRFHLFKGYYLGTGLLTVVGTSFATLSTAFSIFNALYADGTCTSTTNADGTVTQNPCPDAFGALIATTMVTSFIEMLLSFVPPAKLKRIFPPIVTGLVVVLIGASLIGDSGALNWGGGSNDCSGRPTSGIFQLCPTIYAPKAAKWGSPQFIGLGFLSFITIVITEIFGSPFLDNCSIIVGLVVGYIVAGATGYIYSSSITSAPAITFLWVHHFKLRVYGPAVLPCLAVYIALALEANGDITASSEVSRVEVDGPVFDSRIQGGVLADGLAGFLSALGTVTPMSIFAQNNGVIALTKCANRQAGYCCCCFLILFGVLGKISGVFLSIPNPVLGGVTTFLFASVMTSGIRVLSYLKWGRKERFVLAASISFGFGNLLVPTWYTYLFEGVSNPSAGLQGFLSSITIILDPPYLSAAIVGIILWNIIPDERADDIIHHETPIPMADANHLEMGRLDKQPSTRNGDEDYDEIKLHETATSRIEPVM